MAEFAVVVGPYFDGQRIRDTVDCEFPGSVRDAV